MAVLISNLQEVVDVGDGLAELVEKAVQVVFFLEKQQDSAEVSVVFTDDEYIKELNNQYRNLNCSTDVLSFAQHDGDPMPDAGEEDLLGDVVISLQTAARQGEEYGYGLQREVAYLTVHGLLHLLGYDHNEEEKRVVMREREEVALAALGLARE